MNALIGQFVPRGTRVHNTALLIRFSTLAQDGFELKPATLYYELVSLILGRFRPSFHLNICFWTCSLRLWHCWKCWMMIYSWKFDLRNKYSLSLSTFVMKIKYASDTHPVSPRNAMKVKDTSNTHERTPIEIKYMYVIGFKAIRKE